MRIQDVMSKDVLSVTPKTPTGAAREILREKDIDHLVVIDAKRVVGVVAGKDILGVNDDVPVSAVMSRHVVTTEPEATLRRAAGIMRGRAVGCLPVVAEGKLVGIVTTSDLLTALAKGEIHAVPPRQRAIMRRRAPRA